MARRGMVQHGDDGIEVERMVRQSLRIHDQCYGPISNSGYRG